MSPRPALLVIAGHDPSDGPAGYAGVRADREGVEDAARALTGNADALDVRTVVTAWTNQDDLGVRSLGARPAADWVADARREVEAARGVGLRAVKVGLLASAEHVQALAALLRELRAADPRLPIVVDPVLASSSGTTFLDAAGRAALLASVLPIGVILTPNLPEAETLAGGALSAHATLHFARLRFAQTLLARGARAVVLKGGHGEEDPLVDLVLTPLGGAHWLEHPRQPGTLRGTGCRFASALAASLALGAPLKDAARRAGACVASRIATRAD